MAYYRLEPFGFHADNLNAALIASTIVNSQRAKGEPAKISDFLFKLEVESEEPKKQTAEEMKSILLGYVTVKKKKEDKDG